MTGSAAEYMAGEIAPKVGVAAAVVADVLLTVFGELARCRDVQSPAEAAQWLRGEKPDGRKGWLLPHIRRKRIADAIRREAERRGLTDQAAANVSAHLLLACESAEFPIVDGLWQEVSR